MSHVARVLVLALLCCLPTAAQAQFLEDLKLFGYFQSTFSQTDMSGSLGPTQFEMTSNSSNLQQLNLFLSKPLGGDFTAFLNLEAKNSFLSERGWGSFGLEEAWVKYRPSTAFELRAGTLIPTFNNLNEIKNRTPLLPYIFRPMVYEQSLSGTINLGDYVPERAFLQVSGMLPVGPARFEYAAFVGNSEAEYIAPSGQDTTTFKTLGGRAGVRLGNLKVGVSTTLDHDNQVTTRLGNVPRTRLGADLSYALAGFRLEGEVIQVNHDLDVPGVGMDKLFYYGNLTYDFSPKVYAFAGYSHMADEMLMDIAFSGYTFGGGFRPVDRLVVKGQYSKVETEENPAFMFDISALQLAVSVYF